MRINSDENDFCRAVCLAAALLMGCDEAPETTTASPAAQVLEGKTMGTLWRVSVVGIDAKRAAELQTKIQTQLDADDWLLSTYKNNSALMRFNHSRSLAPAGQRSHGGYRDLGAAYWREDGWRDGYHRGPAGQSVGFGPDRQPLHIPTPAQIDAAKAKTGLQHLQVIDRAGHQFCKKICRIFMLISPRSGRAMRRIIWRD